MGLVGKLMDLVDKVIHLVDKLLVLVDIINLSTLHLHMFYAIIGAL